MRTKMDPILLSVPDACQVIGISRSVLYELIAAGELTTRKIGRKTLIPRDDLTSFVARLAALKSEATPSRQKLSPTP
jgi:excisionase family DNA binding protein